MALTSKLKTTFRSMEVVIAVQRRRRRLESDATRGSVRRPSGTGCARGAVGPGVVIRTAALWIIVAAILGGCPKKESSAAVGEVKEAVTEKKCPETAVPSAGGGDRSIGAEAPSDGDYDHVIVLSSDQTSGSVVSQINSQGAGTVLVRSDGTRRTISGDITVPRAYVTFYDLNLNGDWDFNRGTVLWNVNADPFSFQAWGVDDGGDAYDWVVRDSYLSGGFGCCGNDQNHLLSGTSGWLIENNTFTGYHPSSGDSHTEALWIGKAKNGIIRNNQFINNGNTAHIFFTWNGAQTLANYPNNICVEGNTFQDVLNCCYDIQTRAELPSSLNISVDPAQVPQKGFQMPSNWLRTCQ